MTAQDAKRILLACRPVGIDHGDPEVAQALALPSRPGGATLV